MKSQTKSRLLQLSRKELVRLCNEKLVCAARDLAEFTKNGINASFIVALAHKCEHFEYSIDRQHPQGSLPLYNKRETKRTEKEIREGLSRICEVGDRIWSKNPSKKKDYVIPMRMSSSTYADSGSAYVA
jgi:hypothetical protein